MSVNTINAELLQKMFLAGAAALEQKKEYINELNVFPVPDGDTGTNMTMTIMSAASAVGALMEPNMEQICKAISSGSLRGARGNSGVILSQIFRGFTKVVADKEEVDVEILAESIKKAADTAYKAVMKPKEGTILTVARAAANKAEELALTDISMEDFILQVITAMQKALDSTPELLPVLKQAGVVDSGGEGLLTVVKGCYDAFLGKEISFELPEAGAVAAGVNRNDNAGETAEITFGYCTEFIILLENNHTSSKTEEELKKYLSSIGDSLVVVADTDIVKVHVHTNDPGLAIQKALTYGSLSNMKIDNMRLEHQEKVIKDASKIAAMDRKRKEEEQALDAKKEMKEEGFVSVVAGEGLAQIFTELGVDMIIQGGQTMNPSTDDILTAIEQVPAKNVYVFPNNSNIILAAEQAAGLCGDKKVYVIPSKTIPQGIAAMIQYAQGRNPEENAKQMAEGMAEIKSGQVTYAVRDTQIDGKDIKQGDYMGLDEKRILAVGSTPEEVTKELIAMMSGDEAELITLYYGEDITEDEAQALAGQLEECYADAEIEVDYGGQPVYSYLISVE